MKILIADDNERDAEKLVAELENLGYEQYKIALTKDEALKTLREDANEEIGVIFVDWNLPHENDGPQLVQMIRHLKRSSQPYVALMSVQLFHAREAVKHGAEVFLEKHPSPSPDLLVACLQAAERKSRRHREVQRTQAIKSASQAAGHEFFTGGLDEVMFIVSRVAGTGRPVLITGENGTGKELIAQAIHYSDPSRSGAFIAVNCGGMTEGIAASELFGHLKGSFTDAASDHMGAFEQAQSGTIFLDEIGELHPKIQATLLRVLDKDKGTFSRVGSVKEIQSSARVLAATNVDLDEAMAAGRFRRDLYERLHGFRIEMPSLRQRREFIGEISTMFYRHFREMTSELSADLPDATIAFLEAQEWPGNLRQLRNDISRAVTLARGSTLTPSDFDLRRSKSQPVGEFPLPAHSCDFNDLVDGYKATLIRHARRTAKNKNNKTVVARWLELPVATYSDQLKKLEADGYSCDPDDKNGPA
jgi:DNA-binding NtrC family response regulator